MINAKDVIKFRNYTIIYDTIYIGAWTVNIIPVKTNIFVIQKIIKKSKERSFKKF